MDKDLKGKYISILKEELIPAMGCTEPIAIAYASALARQTLCEMPTRAVLQVSANIIKNVKSVVVPHTNGERGIKSAAVAGIVAGNPDKELEVIADITPDEIAKIKETINTLDCSIEKSDKPYIFDICVTLYSDNHTAFVEIAGHHTNVICIKKDNDVILSKEYTEEENETDRSILSVEDIISFADEVNIDEVSDILDRQIKYNTAIAKEGLKDNYGANIGKILLKSYGNDVHNRAKAFAAAASDARMNGCEMPVVINSGSGNQGITASLPVIVYANEYGVSKDILYRSLVVSNLITIHMKTGIGRLSAYCGATSAGCGAGAGITYMQGGKFYEIAHTIVNAVAIDSGMICDGAKASCAAKIASAVEAGLLGMQMQKNGSQFYGGDGIVTKGVENTIRNIGTLASKGMRHTDEEIIKIMLS